MKHTLTIFSTEIRMRWLSLLILSITGFLFASMYIVMFPSISQQADQLQQLTESMGDILKGMGIENTGFTTVESFLSLEYFTIIWPILVFILVGSWAGGQIAGEIDTRVIGRWLSLPISRQTIYWSKYVAALVALLLFCLISAGLLWPATQAVDVDANAQNFLKVSVMCAMFGWALLSFGYLISTIFADRGKVMMFISGLGLSMYVATAVATLKDQLQWLKHFSFFSYLDVQNVLVYGSWEWESVLVFGIVAIACVVAGVIIFQRRDISV